MDAFYSMSGTSFFFSSDQSNCFKIKISSHRAKNLVTGGKQKSTKCGLAVESLQAELPNARVVYSSATGASEPLNMAYMTRLGLWGGQDTPFPADFSAFKNAMLSSGVGMMELVAVLNKYFFLF